MYSLLYKLYFALRRTQKKHADDKGLLYRFSTLLIGYIEAYYNLHVVKKFKNKPSSKKGTTEVKRDQKVVLSLTSFPARINTVWITIETLLRQSMKPDEIILWLAKEQFPDENELPHELLKQKERGLTIRFCDDLKSHKKYFYVMQEYPEDLVILVDDDAFYSRDLVEKLYELHKNNPKDIVCMGVALIEPSIDTPPDKWTRPAKNQVIRHSYIAQPFTGTGTLFPPSCLDHSAFNNDLMKELCPYADDLWLKAASMINGTKVTGITPDRNMPIFIYGTSESGLWHINGKDKQNDVQWQNILNYFGDRL